MTGSKRMVLRTGFSIVIGLLVVATFTAYRIQESFSRKTAEIYRQYVQQQDTFTDLRRILWMAGIHTRDYFINPAGDRLAQYQAEMSLLQQESERLFRVLEAERVPNETSLQLKQKLNDLWIALLAVGNAGWDGQRKYNFVQEEIVPRRNAAGMLLRELERANMVALTESEERFADTRKAAASRLVLTLGIGLLAGILVTGFSLHYSENLERQTARQFEEVSQAKQDLERLSARLMEIQEEERTRLSRELHDEIVQTLAVLKIEITQAQSISGGRFPEIRENLARARDLAERTLKTVRNITLLLRPSLLDDLGLGPALQWQAEDFMRRTKVPCDFEEQGLLDSLPDAVKTCVYRVTQEALHNAEKHARASHLRVAVVQSDHRLTVEVEDNGIGFGPRANADSPVSMHFGLLGMRERAAGLGGTLTVDSRPGKGTRVRLWLPLNENAVAASEDRAEAHV
ncbi:MAG: sensor histidine kinase [Bryobacteraceae bacterium]